MTGKDKGISMEILLHSADISNPIKPFDLYKRWTGRIRKEFFSQGDKERELGLPISYLMDRYSVNIAKGQISFIDVIVRPQFEALIPLCPSIKPYFVNFEQNKQLWEDRISYYEDKLSFSLVFYSGELNANPTTFHRESLFTPEEELVLKHRFGAGKRRESQQKKDHGR